MAGIDWYDLVILWVSVCIWVGLEGIGKVGKDN